MDTKNLARLHTTGHRAWMTLAVVAALASTAPVRAATLTWWATGSTGASGGTGNWDTTNLRWTADGSTWSAWNNAANDVAFFAGTAGTVTLTAPITANGLTFATTGYTVTGGTLTFAGTTPTITTNAGVSTTISTILAGSTTVTKAGAGSLTLSGANTFSGNMTISSGTVLANLTVNSTSPSATSLGNMTTVGRTVTTSTGATLYFNAADAIGQYNYATPVTLVADGGTITRAAGQFNSLGALDLRNGGRLTTNNGQNATVNSFSLNGNVTVSGTSGSFIDTVGTTNNGLHLATGVAGSTITFTVNSTGDPTADLTVSAPLIDKTLGGAASITKTGSGRMVLAATNTYTGATTINLGTLQIGNNSASGAISTSSAISGSAGATLAFARTDTVTQGSQFNNVIGGAINVSQLGSGTLVLSNANTYTGTTTAAAGTILASGTGSVPGFGSAGRVVFNGGTLAVQVGGSGWTTGQVDTLLTNATKTAGALGIDTTNGSLTQWTAFTTTNFGANLGLVKLGTNALTLSSSNTYAGGTTLRAGQLNLNNANAIGTGTFTIATGTIDNTSGGSITLATNNPQVWSGDYTFAGSNPLNLGTGAVALSANRQVTVTSSTLTASGAVSGAFALTKAGAGTLVLTASNSYSGGTTLNAGMLSFGTNSLGITGNVTLNGGTLQWASGNSQDLSARLTLVNSTTVALDTNGNNVTLASTFGSSASAAIVKTGAGNLTLSANNNTFSGNMTILSGTLIANSTQNNNNPTSTALGNMMTAGRTITAGTGATLMFTQPDSIGNYISNIAVTLIADGGTITRNASVQQFNSIGSLILQNGGRLRTTNGNASTVGSFAINGSVTVQGTAGSFIDTLSGQTTNSYVNLGTTTGTTVFNVASTGDPTADLSVSAVLGDKVLGGAAVLVKSGAGSMLMSAANTYSGGTVLRAGTIVAANSTALGSAGTVTINDASTGSSNTSLLIGGSFTIGGPISVANQGSGSVTIGSTGLTTGAQAVYSGAITLAKDVTLLGASGGDRTQFSGGIGGTGNVTIAGAGRTIFSTTANSYAGTTTINGTSTLQLSDGTTTANSLLPDNFAVTVGGLLTLAKGGNSETIDALLGSGTVRAVAGADTLIVGNAGGSGTFSGILKDDGGTLAFTKSGAGTQVLTGANTYTGVTTITGGTLQVGNAGTTGSIVSNAAVSAGAALTFSRSDGLTYSGTVSGAGNLVQIGTGTLTLTANSTYTGTTSLTAGVVSLGAANAIGTTGTISFTGGTLQYSASNTTDYSNRFSTAASQNFRIDTNGQAVSLGTALTSSGATLTKLGSGTLTLTAASTYSGNTTISAGVLQLGSGGAAGAVAGNIAVASGASLVVNRSDAYTLSNLVSGSGGLSQVGSGTTSLSNGGNSYTGATTITGGVLAVSTDLNLGSVPGSATPGSIVIDGGTLAFTSGFPLSSNRGIALGPISGSGTGTIDVASGQSLAYGGVIANNGAGTDGLVKTGAGVLALTGAATYTGDTSVNAGTLQIGSGGSLASPLVAVASGATLSGRGTVNAVSVSSGGILAPGITNTGTLTTGGLTFGGLATVTMGVSGTVPGNLLSVLGNVTTLGSGTSVTFAFGGSLANIVTGTYSLLTYTGTLSDPSAFGFSGTKGGRQSVEVSGTTVANAVSLVIGNSFPIWTGTNGTGWFASDNWELNTDFTPTNFQNADTVEFNDLATSGTVVISGSNATPASTTFSGDTKDMTVEATGGFGISTGSVVKSGSALVTITNANSYDGGTTLSAGRLRVGDDGALGTGVITVTGPAALSSDGATAHTLANGLTLNADITLGDAADSGNLTMSGTVTFGGSARTITTPSNVTLSGLVTNGGLTKAGAGTMTITGSNNYANGTTLSAGTLRVGNDAALGVGGVSLADGVTLSSNGTTARTLANVFTLNGDVTLGDATDTGALTIGAGGISLGGGTRQVTTPSNVTFAGAVTSGGITKAGAGTLTLSTANSYAAGTTLSAGDITLGNAAGLGTGTATYAGAGTIRNTVAGTITNAIVVNAGIAAGFDSAANVTTLSGAVANAGTFTLTTSATQTLSNVVSGTGALVKAGSGRAVLSATSTYTGDTTIAAGVLELGGAGLLGNGSYGGAITNSGTLSITSSAAQTLSGGIANAGAISVNAAGNQTISGAVSGVGSLTKAGAGTLTLSNAANSYSGGSTITGGTVAFSNGALGSSGSVTVSGGALRWATGNTQDISSRLALVNAATATLDVGTNNVIFASGLGAGTSGAVTKTGAGTLTLTAANGYTGLTTVSGGTLQIGAGGATGSVAGDIATAATVAFNRSDAATYSGLISGAGDVRQIGSGTLTLTGNNTFSGQLTVAQGAVAVSSVNNASANGPLGNSTNSVVLGSSGATGLLSYTGATASSTKRFTLATGGTGALSVPSATTLTLSGSIDGSGAFVKQGPGTLSLSGASPFTGNMTISSGTVIAGLTVNTGSPNATSLGNMTTSNRTITVNSGATLRFTAADAIGAYNYATPVTLIADGGTITRSYTAQDYFNSIGNLELRNGGRLTTADGGNANVASMSINGNVTVSGTSGSFIDTVGTSFNGVNLGSAGVSTTFTVNSTGDPTADLTVSAPLYNQVFQATASVVKAGAGKMLLTAANSYSGNTTINAGTFAIGPGGQIYNGGFRVATVTVGSGAMLDLQNWAYNETSTQSLGGLAANETSIVVNGGTIRISGTAPTSYGRGVTVNSGGATLEAAAGASWTIDTVNDSFAWVYNGNPSITLAGGGTGRFDKVLGNGTGGLTKSGSGTWTLTGVNTFTGNTTISAGTLVLGGAGQLGGGTYGGNISNAGSLQVTTSANQTLSGVVSGVGSLSKSGAGTLTLSNASNSFSGGATLTAGVLSFANDALGPSGTISLGGGTLQWASGNTQDISSRLALANSTTTTLDVGSNDVTLANNVGAGSTAGLVKSGAGALTLSSSNGFSGDLSVAAGTIRMGNDAALGSGGVLLANGAAISSDGVTARSIANAVTANGNVTLGDATNSGSLSLTGGVNLGGGTRTLATPSNVTIASVVSNGGLTKAGAGVLTLSAANTYTGATTINAGSLALSGLGDISSGSAAVVTIAPGAALDISAASGARTIGALDGGDATSQVILGGNSLRSVVAGPSQFGGVISGAGGFTKAGSAQLEMTSIQAFTGLANIEEGRLLIASGTGLASASKIYVASGAFIESYGGALTVVNSQTLGGYGTISGDLAFAPGGILSPGGSVGTLFGDAGTTTWNGGMHYLFEVNSGSGTPGGPTGWDLFSTTGGLTLVDGDVSPIVIDLTSLSGTSSGLAANFDESFNYAWKFAVAGSEISTFNPTWFTVTTSNFQNLPGSPERFYVARGDSVTGGTSSELYIVYAAVPEPGTLALAGIGLAAAGWAARRQRRRRAG